MRRRRLQRGLTMAEVLVSAAISTTVLFSAVSVFLSGMATWARGQGKIETETQSRQVVRVISDALREAMLVTVDADGLGVTYRRPLKDAAGSFVVPIVWDGQTCRIFHQNGQLMMNDGAGTRSICRNVRLTDPYSPGGTAPYKIFTPGPGAITRRLTVQIVTETNGARTEKVVARKREMIFLRNIPELTR